MAKRAQIEAIRPALTAIDKEVTAAEHVIDAVVSGADKATGALETGLETVADVVPEVLDKSVHATAEVTRRGVLALRDPRKVIILLGLTGAVAGAALGIVAYKLQKKHLEKQFEERLNKELEDMRLFYMRRNKAGEFATPRTAAEALLAKDAVEALETYQGNEVETPKVEEEGSVPKEIVDADGTMRYDKVITNSDAAEQLREKVVKLEEPTERNIFVDGKPLVDDDWDQAAEEARRNEESPYVISHDEFLENSFEHHQTRLTYYSGDDVLADDQDDMITEVESIVGTENLTRFGQGSRDPKVVYVRNERTEADYEVVLSSGKFAEEVMGLRHSDESPRLRRARWGDDE